MTNSAEPHATNPATTPKRLIVLCDGTWQDSVSGEAYTYPTNVTRISRALSQFGEQDGQLVPQIIYYQPGVGTGIGDKLQGGVYGAGLSANVRAAYGFLAHNYNPGDQIYFFGFSRGAYTARAIAGLVTSLGLLTKRGMDNFSAIYQEYYRKQSSRKPGQTEPDLAKLQQLAKGQLHEGAEKAVEIVGVWDTVGFHASNIGGEEFEFWNTRLSANVTHGFHALSLDETREAFLPTLWDSSCTADDGKNASQVWFSGVHSEVGGGLQDSALADISLGWMIAKCAATKTLSFVDVAGSDPVDSKAWYLIPKDGPTSDGGNEASTDTAAAAWTTSEYPKPAEPLSLHSVITKIKETATNLFWRVANFVLPAKTGVRQPNTANLKPDETNERIHPSIRDRHLFHGSGGWPCTPIKGQVDNSRLWELVRPKGAVLEETTPDAVELSFKGRIRGVDV